MATPKLYLNTIFRWCNDIDAMRTFYSNILHLDETFYRNDQERGWLTYQIDKLQLVFIRSSSPQTIDQEWAITPAYAGTQEQESWILAVKEDVYAMLCERIELAQITHHEVDNTMIFVQDPMGFTLEIWLEQ